MIHGQFFLLLGPPFFETGDFVDRTDRGVKDMNSFKSTLHGLVLSATCILFIMPFLGSVGTRVYGQGSNSIAGVIFGLNRQPLTDINVELLDEFSRTVQRVRTSSGGWYMFSRLPAGRYKVRVMPFGTNYEEKEEEVELVNFSRSRADGSSAPFGFTNEQLDLYLRLRKGAEVAENTAVFIQDVPDAARKLYEKGIADLDARKQDTGLAALKSSIETFPKYFNALERLGTEYVRLGKPGYYDAAEILLTMAVNVNPRGYKSWYGLAYSRYSLKKYAEALPAAQKATELNSNSPEYSFLLGTLLRHNKRFSESEKALGRARDLSKDMIPQVHWELALLYANNMTRYADAARELKLFLKAQTDTRDAEKIKALIAEFEAKSKKKDP